MKKVLLIGLTIMLVIGLAGPALAISSTVTMGELLTTSNVLDLNASSVATLSHSVALTSRDGPAFENVVLNPLIGLGNSVDNHTLIEQNLQALTATITGGLLSSDDFGVAALLMGAEYGVAMAFYDSPASAQSSDTNIEGTYRFEQTTNVVDISDAQAVGIDASSTIIAASVTTRPELTDEFTNAAGNAAPDIVQMFQGFSLDIAQQLEESLVATVFERSFGPVGQEIGAGFDLDTGPEGLFAPTSINAGTLDNDLTVQASQSFFVNIGELTLDGAPDFVEAYGVGNDLTRMFAQDQFSHSVKGLVTTLDASALAATEGYTVVKMPTQAVDSAVSFYDNDLNAATQASGFDSNLAASQQALDANALDTGFSEYVAGATGVDKFLNSADGTQIFHSASHMNLDGALTQGFVVEMTTLTANTQADFTDELFGESTSVELNVQTQIDEGNNVMVNAQANIAQNFRQEITNTTTNAISRAAPDAGLSRNAVAQNFSVDFGAQVNGGD